MFGLLNNPLVCSPILLMRRALFGDGRAVNTLGETNLLPAIVVIPITGHSHYQTRPALLVAFWSMVGSRRQNVRIVCNSVRSKLSGYADVFNIW
jgi:hypothetical protein